jgi:murein DD-endopeptidase MepM/ murein hydrolase activator NlpD
MKRTTMNTPKLKYIHVTLIFCLLTVASFENQAALFKRANNTYIAAENLPKESLVPGGIALIPFKHKSKTAPKVTFHGNQVMVLQTSKKQWLAVVGLSLKLKPGEYFIELYKIKKSSKDEPETEKIHFEIKDKEYQAQYITLKNKKQVSPSQKSLDRIREESRTMKDVFRSFSEQAPTVLAMDYPVEGPLSSEFGLKRFFNMQARNPHSGIDIAAPKGSEIQSPLAGIVAATGMYYFNGNTVLIDHGQGFVAMYCHLDQISVSKGQTIKAGEILGTVGSTGRATGPHLHWSLNLNNTRIDPLLFLNTHSESQ